MNVWYGIVNIEYAYFLDSKGTSIIYCTHGYILAILLIKKKLLLNSDLKTYFFSFLFFPVCFH